MEPPFPAKNVNKVLTDVLKEQMITNTITLVVNTDTSVHRNY